MSSHPEDPGPAPLESSASGIPDEAGGPASTGGDDGFLGRFPEAVDASRSEGGQQRRGGSVVGYRIVLSASLVVGAIAGLALIVTWILQLVLTSFYIRVGGEYFGPGLESTTARELLTIPTEGFIGALLLSFAGLCIAMAALHRGRQRTDRRPRTEPS